MTNSEKSLLLHEEWAGKLETISKCAIKSREDLALAYTPGVAEPCIAIKNDYKKSFELISDGIFELIKNGIDVKLYNFPLCTIDKKYWTLCEKSISPQKVRFAEGCDKCLMKELCGGVFAGTYLLEKEELEAIV